MVGKYFIHKKSSGQYKVLHLAESRITGSKDMRVVVYTDSVGKVYVREKWDFMEKFEECKPDVKATVVQKEECPFKYCDNNPPCEWGCKYHRKIQP